MAKAPLITDSVQALIARVYQKYPKWKAPVVRNEVDYILHRKTPKLPPGWPSLSTVQKVLAKVRKAPSDRKDKPFCLGALVDYPIPPEALPTVLEALAQYRKQGDALTIREALWFSRLSSALSKFKKVGDKDRNLGNLVQWYAIRERAYEAIGEDIDTTDLDTAVLQLLKLEEEKEEDKTLPFVYEDGYIKDATGKIRGQVHALNEDSYQPKGQKKKGGIK